MTETQRRPANPRIAWFETLGSQTERNRPAPDVLVPPPASVRAQRGRGQVTVSWTPVEGAAGYLVSRADTPDGELVPIDHEGGDVLAVPHGPYVDTTGDIASAARYAVASLSSIDAPVGEPSPPVAPIALPDAELGRVAITVDAASGGGPIARPWRPCIGSEHLALLRSIQQETGGNLAETLANLSDIVRRRRQMRLKISALSGEAKASAYILGSLPFIMFLMVQALNPDYAGQLFTDPRGLVMVGAGIGSMLVGIAIMMKMIRFEI